MQTELEPPAPAPSTMAPDRAEYLRRATTATVGAVLDRMLAGLGTSTDTPQEGTGQLDRLMMRALRPWLPRLRDRLLSSLSEADPTDLEHVLSGLGNAIEAVLRQAPGEALPAYYFRWNADARGYDLVAVPTDG